MYPTISTYAYNSDDRTGATLCYRYSFKHIRKRVNLTHLRFTCFINDYERRTFSKRPSLLYLYTNTIRVPAIPILNKTIFSREPVFLARQHNIILRNIRVTSLQNTFRNVLTVKL